jgi:hypothetical protein
MPSTLYVNLSDDPACPFYNQVITLTYQGTSYNDPDAWCFAGKTFNVWEYNGDFPDPSYLTACSGERVQLRWRFMIGEQGEDSCIACAYWWLYTKYYIDGVCSDWVQCDSALPAIYYEEISNDPFYWRTEPLANFGLVPSCPYCTYSGSLGYQIITE